MNLGQQIFAKNTWWLINMLDRDYVSTEIIITGIYTQAKIMLSQPTLTQKQKWFDHII